jgi:bile acid:Na+ symporter, BASS family
MNPQEIVSLALKVSIILTLFGFGLQASRDDLLYVLRRPRVLARSLLAMFVVMPLFALLLTTIFHFELPVMIALVALAISPVPPALPRKVNKAGGLAPYGLGLMVTVATLSILYVPLAVSFIGAYFHKPFAMGPGAVAKLIGLSVLLPLAVGIVFERIEPALARHIAKPVGLVAKILLMLGLAATLTFALPKSLSLIGNGTLPALIAFIVVGWIVGYLVGGPGTDERVTLAFSTACRHPGLALSLAAANIPHEHSVFSAILLYLVLNALLTIPYIFWRRHKIKDQTIPATPQLSV